MSGNIPQQFIDDLLSRVDIVDVINRRVTLQKKGKEYQACCPFHGEKTPSFTVSPSKQFYHCFGCGAHGTAVGFLMEYDRLSFPEAIEELATDQGIEVPRELTFNNKGPDHKPIYDLLQKVSEFYELQLREHPTKQHAIDYLKQRGLSGEIAKDFALGYAPPGWDNVLKRFGGDEKKLQVLRDAGLISEKENDKRYDRMRERIIFPIRDGRGRVIGFGGRVLGDDKPKYLNSPETPVFHKGQELYGLYETRQTHKQPDQILVVEGYMDVVALAQFDIRNAVATLGTATTPDHLKKLYRTANEVVFCFDGDRAGRDAAWKALKTALPLMSDGRQARFLFLPNGEDPDSLVRKIGTDAFREELQHAQPLSEFLFAKLESQVDTNSIDGLARMGELAKPLLSELPQGTFRVMMEKALEQRLGVSVDIGKAKPPENTPIKRQAKPVAASSAPGMSPVSKAVAIVLQHPNAALAELPANWRNLPEKGIEVLANLIDRVKSNPDTHSAALVEAADESLRSYLAKLAIANIAVMDDAPEQLSGILFSLLRSHQKNTLQQSLTDKPVSQMSDEEKQKLRDAFKR